MELEPAVSGLEEDDSPSRFCLVRAFMVGRCGLLWGIWASAGALLRRLNVIGLLMRTASVMVLYSERGGGRLKPGCVLIACSFYCACGRGGGGGVCHPVVLALTRASLSQWTCCSDDKFAEILLILLGNQMAKGLRVYQLVFETIRNVSAV